MTNSNLTEIVVVLDRSGSMFSIKDDMQGALREFLKTQKELDGEVKFTIAHFDNEYELKCDNAEPGEVVESALTLEPRGSTALFDAVGRTINSVGARLAATDEAQRPGKVLFAVITDGQENASREFTSTQIQEMVARQENDYSWNFVFLGADLDTAVSIGANVNSSITYAANRTGVRGVTDAFTAYTIAYRATGSARFADVDRKAAQGQ